MYRTCLRRARRRTKDPARGQHVVGDQRHGDRRRLADEHGSVGVDSPVCSPIWRPSGKKRPCERSASARTASLLTKDRGSRRPEDGRPRSAKIQAERKRPPSLIATSQKSAFSSPGPTQKPAPGHRRRREGPLGATPDTRDQQGVAYGADNAIEASGVDYCGACAWSKLHRPASSWSTNCCSCSHSAAVTLSLVALSGPSRSRRAVVVLAARCRQALAASSSARSETKRSPR
jgi:hypothetical protein